jgi:LysM repeat protein
MTQVFLHRALPAAAILLLAACAGMRHNEPAAPAGATSDATSATAPAQASGAPAPATSPAPHAEASAPARPSKVLLAPNAPERYTVVKGDTLWDISGKFLKDPWFWPEIWQVNPQIANPHLIYPGDVISLVYVGGQPQLRLERGGEVVALPEGTSTERLSPQARVEPLGQAITTIPYDAIAPFLTHPTVLSKDQVDGAPYVLAFRGGHLVAGKGQTMYARGPESLLNGASYAVYHVGEPYRDPDTNHVIGYEGIYVGQGQVIRGGDPATLTITDSRREATPGDRLFPVEVDVPLNFYPSAPSAAIEGRIVAVLDGLSRIGQYNIVVLNRGAKDGLAQGHVLEIYQADGYANDRWTSEHWPGSHHFPLPEEKAGLLMVFRVLDDISYALVTQATSEIRVADVVRNP